jgi:hypothetical protein
MENAAERLVPIDPLTLTVGLMARSLAGINSHDARLDYFRIATVPEWPTSANPGFFPVKISKRFIHVFQNARKEKSRAKQPYGPRLVQRFLHHDFGGLESEGYGRI